MGTDVLRLSVLSAAQDSSKMVDVRIYPVDPLKEDELTAMLVNPLQGLGGIMFRLWREPIRDTFLCKDAQIFLAPFVARLSECIIKGAAADDAAKALAIAAYFLSLAQKGEKEKLRAELNKKISYTINW